MIACAIDAGGVPGPAGLPFVMTAGATYNFAFVPSARTFHANSSIQQQRAWDYTRQSTYTYSVGYSERVTLVANSSANWRWRRIVFTMKNLEPAQSFQSGALFNYNTSVGPSPAMCGLCTTLRTTRCLGSCFSVKFFRELRVWTTVIHLMPRSTLPAFVFCTTRILVWLVEMTQRIGAYVAFITAITLVSFTMRRRLAITKDTGSEASHYNNSSRLGQGDLWVVDMFACAGGSGSDELRFLPQGTYYWHERAKVYRYR